MAISSDDIETAAKGPKRVMGDEGSVTERSVDELIKADAYNKGANTQAAPFGLHVAKIKFPGTV